MRAFFVIICFFFSSLAIAEDGLSVQFTIDRRVEDSNRLQSFTSAILMRFDEEASFDLGKIYVLKIRSRPLGDERLNLIITLKDVVHGKPYYVGAHPVEIEIGESQTIHFTREGMSNTVNLDTAYGTIPE